MKVIIFRPTYKDGSHTYSHTEITTTADKIFSLERTEDGYWLNAEWIARGGYNYEVIFTDNRRYEIDEDTYEYLKKEVYNL